MRKGLIRVQFRQMYREGIERREIAISGRESLIHIGQLARTSRERDKELATGISWWKMMLYDFPINDEK